MVEKSESAANVLVDCVKIFKEPTLIVDNFLHLVANMSYLTKDNIDDAIGMLQCLLEESPFNFPRLLFGVELVSSICDERKWSMNLGIERVLRKYTESLTQTIGRINLYPNNEMHGGVYELALDIAYVFAVNAADESKGTINTLIRTIVAGAPEEVLEAKLVQLESPDFLEERKEDRRMFYDIFVIEYLRRFYGMNKVMKQLRERKGLLNTVRIDTSGKRYCSMDETKLWKILKNNCEITDPTQNQQLDRQFMTAELVRRHPEDNMVKDWYEENFPHLVRT